MKELSGEKDGKRIIWLDFVKFIAIFMMIAVHCTDNVTPAERHYKIFCVNGKYGIQV